MPKLGVGQHLLRIGARDINGSPLWRHCVEEHRGETQQFEMNVTGSYRNDTMRRQISEAVQIERTETELLIYDRAEWNMTSLPRTVIT